jgi:SET domain-containing protein
MKDTEKVHVAASRHGRGGFAKLPIRAGEEIVRFQGQLLRCCELPCPYDSVEDHYVQIGEDLHMGPSGRADDFINHSCDPNSGLVIQDGKVTLVAIRDIAAAEEIFWDYSTTIDGGDWEMDCRCASELCRGKISGFKFLPDGVKERYAQLGIVPEYNLKYVPRGLWEEGGKTNPFMHAV